MCDTADILRAAAELPDEHPGWRLLSLLAEYTEEIPDFVFPAARRDLARLTTRLKDGEFTTTRPFAIVVWLLCRLKTYTDPTDDVSLPAHWKDHMKTVVRSPVLVSSRSVKSTLAGSVDMVFGCVMPAS